jgi:hypothetical protein
MLGGIAVPGVFQRGTRDGVLLRLLGNLGRGGAARQEQATEAHHDCIETTSLHGDLRIGGHS